MSAQLREKVIKYWFPYDYAALHVAPPIAMKTWFAQGMDADGKMALDQEIKTKFEADWTNVVEQNRHRGKF